MHRRNAKPDFEGPHFQMPRWESEDHLSLTAARHVRSTESISYRLARGASTLWPQLPLITEVIVGASRTGAWTVSARDVCVQSATAAEAAIASNRDFIILLHSVRLIVAAPFCGCLPVGFV